MTFFNKQKQEACWSMRGASWLVYSTSGGLGLGLVLAFGSICLFSPRLGLGLIGLVMVLGAIGGAHSCTSGTSSVWPFTHGGTATGRTVRTHRG